MSALLLAPWMRPGTTYVLQLTERGDGVAVMVGGRFERWATDQDVRDVLSWMVRFGKLPFEDACRWQERLVPRTATPPVGEDRGKRRLLYLEDTWEHYCDHADRWLDFAEAGGHPEVITLAIRKLHIAGEKALAAGLPVPPRVRDIAARVRRFVARHRDAEKVSPGPCAPRSAE